MSSFEIPKTRPKLLSWYFREGGDTGLLFCYDYRLTYQYEQRQDCVEDIDAPQRRIKIKGKWVPLDMFPADRYFSAKRTNALLQQWSD